MSLLLSTTIAQYDYSTLSLSKGAASFDKLRMQIGTHHLNSYMQEIDMIRVMA